MPSDFIVSKTAKILKKNWKSPKTSQTVENLVTLITPGLQNVKLAILSVLDQQRAQTLEESRFQ